MNWSNRGCMSSSSAPTAMLIHTSAPVPASMVGVANPTAGVARAPATGAPLLSQKRAPARSGAPQAQYPGAAAEVEATSSGAGGDDEALVSVSAGGVSVFDSRGSFEMSIGCSPPAAVGRAGSMHLIRALDPP